MSRAGLRPPAGKWLPYEPSDAALCVFAVCGTDASAGAGGRPGPAPAPSALPSPASLTRLGHAGGGPVTLLALGEGLSAVVQEVEALEFTQEALTRRLSDRAELEACVRAHHATVAATAALGPVVPLPLVTLFTGPDRARARLAERLPRFHAALARVRGRSEWAVKVCRQLGAPPHAAASPSGPDGTAGSGSGSGSGRAYLDRLRERERDRHTRDHAAAAAAGRVHLAAAPLAVGCVHRHPHGPEITGKDRRQLMNAAYLVPHERTDDFREAVRRAAGDVAGAGVRVEITGPWVPYSFTEPDGPAGTARGGTSRPGRP